MIQVANISILYPRATSTEKLATLSQNPIKLLAELLKSYEKMYQKKKKKIVLV